MNENSHSHNEKELLDRIAQLELENKAVKSKLNRLEMKSLATEPLCRPDPNSKHEFRVELTRDLNDRISIAHTVDGVEVRVRLIRQYEKAGDIKFAAMLIVRNSTDGHKFVLTTMEIGQKCVEVPGNTFGTLCGPVSQHFALCSAEEEEQGTRRVFKMKETYAKCAVTIYVRVTVAVQSISSSELAEDDERIVVVKEEKFPVSAAYLSTWSRYFEVYFRSNLKEKQEGLYPISDEDISPSDFRELLAVILPTDKPITKNNFMRLLTMAQRFEMPELTRRVECFLIDFDRNEMNRASVFRIATDEFQLKLVQSALVHRWDNLQLLQRELVQTPEYDKLSAETKVFINEKFVQAYIEKEEGSGSSFGNYRDQSPPRGTRNRSNRDRHGNLPPEFRTLNNPVNDDDW